MDPVVHRIPLQRREGDWCAACRTVPVEVLEVRWLTHPYRWVDPEPELVRTTACECGGAPQRG